MYKNEVIMTDYQYSSIIEMIDMVLEGCKDIPEARRKLARLKKHREYEDASSGDDKREE